MKLLRSGKQFDFNKTNFAPYSTGKSIHQLAIDLKDEEGMTEIVDALFKNRLCSQNTFDPAYDNCMIDDTFMDCLDPVEPDTGIYIDYNHLHMQRTTMLGSTIKSCSG